MASKKAEKLKQAGASLDKLFSGVAENQEKDYKEPDKEAEVSWETKPEKPKKVKKVFSFRADASAADSWRVWADAKGMKVDELGEKAIIEYIKRHPLAEDQKQIYDLKMARRKT